MQEDEANEKMRLYKRNGEVKRKKCNEKRDKKKEMYTERRSREITVIELHEVREDKGRRRIIK